MTDLGSLGVECGACGGPVYMETCDVDGHDWAVASECQRCGDRHVVPSGCLDCAQNDTDQ